MDSVDENGIVVEPKLPLIELEAPREFSWKLARDFARIGQTTASFRLTEYNYSVSSGV